MPCGVEARAVSEVICDLELARGIHGSGAVAEVRLVINKDEAMKSFETAAPPSPSCAMCPCIGTNELASLARCVEPCAAVLT